MNGFDEGNGNGSGHGAGNGFDIGQWALEDEDLEALMLGQSPGEAGLVGNPVAEFFSDVHQGRGVVGARPDQGLQHLFTTGAFLPAGVGGEVVLPQPPPGTGTAYHGEPTAPAAPDPPGPVADLAGQPTLVGAAAPGPVDRGDGAPFRQPTMVQSPMHYPKVYRSSPVDAVLALLRPTGPKMLMALALVLLTAAGVDALGLADVPFLSEEKTEGQAINSTPAKAGEESVGTSSSTTFDRSGGATLPPVTTVSIPPTRAGKVTSGATVEDTTSSETTETTLEDTTSSETSETTADTTTSSETSETTADTTTSSETTETTADTTTSSETTETSASSTSTPEATLVSITTTRRRFVPLHIPAGFYQAVVPEGDGCSLGLSRVGGGNILLEAAPGETVSFKLNDGDSLVNGAGCPNLYTVVPLA